MRDCMPLKHDRAACAVCGGPAHHCPLKHAGLFCGEHCPVCGPSGSAHAGPEHVASPNVSKLAFRQGPRKGVGAVGIPSLRR